MTSCLPSPAAGTSRSRVPRARRKILSLSCRRMDFRILCWSWKGNVSTRLGVCCACLPPCSPGCWRPRNRRTSGNSPCRESPTTPSTSSCTSYIQPTNERSQVNGELFTDLRSKRNWFHIETVLHCFCNNRLHLIVPIDFKMDIKVKKKKIKVLCRENFKNIHFF